MTLQLLRQVNSSLAIGTTQHNACATHLIPGQYVTVRDST
jgi:hypothetical protein